MTRKKTAEETKRQSLMEEINDLVLGLKAQAGKIESHIDNEGLDHMRTDDLDYLAMSLSKVLDECDGVMPSLVSKDHYTS